MKRFFPFEGLARRNRELPGGSFLVYVYPFHATFYLGHPGQSPSYCGRLDLIRRLNTCFVTMRSGTSLSLLLCHPGSQRLNDLMYWLLTWQVNGDNNSLRYLWLIAVSPIKPSTKAFCNTFALAGHSEGMFRTPIVSIGSCTLCSGLYLMSR